MSVSSVFTMPDTVRQAPISGDRYYNPRGGDTPGFGSTPSPTVSPSNSFKRSKSSTFYLLDRRTSPPPGRLLEPQNVIAATERSAASFFWGLIKAIVGLRWVGVLLFRVPSMWLRFGMRSAWSCTRIPFVTARVALRLTVHRRQRRHRTVLISGASTVQALHMARNFYQTGARVIVCEIDGRAELTSFSVAADGYYTVPRPTEDSCVQYVDALRKIVEKERVSFYVPTGTTVSSYHEAVAKSHLELLGCRCHTPGLDAMSVLGDLSEVFRQCNTHGLPVPKHLTVCSKEDIVKLYDNVQFRADRHFIVNVGLSGCKSRHSLQLPADRKSLKLPGPVSDDSPWLLVQNCPGTYYTTCTTVLDGMVIGNVTCRRGNSSVHAVTPNQLVDDWVTRFVGTLPFAFDGILMFSVCVSPSRKVIPMGCHVGVPVSYTSYTSNLERILYPTPPHRICYEPEIEITERYYAMELAYETVTRMTTAAGQSIKQFLHTVLTKSEMVFAYWDPLPYFVYYNLQIPIDYVNNILDKVMLSCQKNKYTTFQ
ncbi:Hypothetical protein CINCED_3A016355 [Cinara cedri]|uniref:Uncharacterized protein n=1 Tax=Cinara cedri TaxID=506608 RepID=A0A5E4LZB5_9HEMI|nr:Hypothetical protein CINCED_3A016355 [Cinara cedri]